MTTRFLHPLSSPGPGRAAYAASEAECADVLVEDGDLNGENAADGEGDTAEAMDRVKCEYDSRTRLAIACDGPTLRGIQSPLLLLRNSVIRALSDSFDFVRLCGVKKYFQHDVGLLNEINCRGT